MRGSGPFCVCRPLSATVPNMARFNYGVWDHLFPAEQARIANALIERITVRKDGISIKWHTKGMPKFLRDSVMQPIYQEAA